MGNGMEGRFKPKAPDAEKAPASFVPPSEVLPVLEGMEERVANIKPEPFIGEGYSLDPETAKGLGETLKNIGAK